MLIHRISQRHYSDAAWFYRDRVRGWHDDERLNLTRPWLDKLRKGTMKNHWALPLNYYWLSLPYYRRDGKLPPEPERLWQRRFRRRKSKKR